MLKGVRHPSNKHIYYPSAAVHNIRNHDDAINMGKLIEKETNKDRKDGMIRETGINSFFQKKLYIANRSCIDYYYFIIQELKDPVSC